MLLKRPFLEVVAPLFPPVSLKASPLQMQSTELIYEYSSEYRLFISFF
jgi:hypothetical protein